ncbi:MAG TPA: hypothetical protein VJU86_17855 [Pyrinomonadaceae bacterium]|nr:hypothetical protein [Pyrinomonadaceae bacterium]
MRLSKAQFTLLLAILCWLPVAETNAQSHPPDLDQYGRWMNKIGEPWWFPETLSKDLSAAAQLRWESIAASKSSATNVWSGDYFKGGDTHGTYLRWSSAGGFVIFHVDKCAATVTGLSYGTVEASADHVKLLVEARGATSTGHVHSVATSESINLIPVIWRETRYLVWGNQIEEFSDYITGRGQFNDSSIYFEYLPFFAKSSDNSSIAEESGKSQPRNPNAFEGPLFPRGYEKFIKKPIDAIITARGKDFVRDNSDNEWWNDLIMPVSLSAGANQGLKIGMLLRVVGATGFGGGEELVRITSVAHSSAKGVIERPIRKVPCVKIDVTDDCANPKYRPVRVGARLTTNPVRD